jgi:glycerol uptake facilitator-like aquaporin
MFTVARTLGTMWVQRWQALREDEGASTIEYLLLVFLGIVVAGLATVAVRAAVVTHNKDIK